MNRRTVLTIMDSQQYFYVLCHVSIKLIGILYSLAPQAQIPTISRITLSVCTSVRLYICPSVILSMCPILSEQYLLNRSTILNQTWYCGVLSGGKLSDRKRKKKLVPYRQCQGHNEGLYNQNMTISTMSSKLLVRLQPNSVCQYNIISQSVLRKNWITALKVKVTPKVKNVSEYLSG